MVQDSTAFKIIAGKSTRRRPLGKSKLKDNIRTLLNGIGVIVRNWIDSTQEYLRAFCEFNIKPPPFISHDDIFLV